MRNLVLNFQVLIPTDFSIINRTKKIKILNVLKHLRYYMSTVFRKHLPMYTFVLR